MAVLYNGAAIFSTDLGRFAPRQPAVLPGRIILRSVPEEDMESKISDLEAKFPDQCKTLTSPIANLYDYFDQYDQELHGAVFLRAVLEEICVRNLVRKQGILDFTFQWIELNPIAFPHILSLGLDAFTVDDVETFGEDFLQDALSDLQLRKLRHDDAVVIAFNNNTFPSNAPTQHPGGAQITTLQQGQQLHPTVQRNFSDPTSLLRMDVVPPQMTASVPPYTPMMSQGFHARAPFPPSLQRVGPTKNEPLKPFSLSGQPDPQRRNDNYGYPSNLDISRNGFRDMFFGVPNPQRISGQHSHHQVPPGPMGYSQIANRQRTFLKSKGPVYVGPSNDARILERQGVPRGRGSFGERHVYRANPNAFGPQIPHSRQLPPSQQSQLLGPRSGPPSQASGPTAITSTSLAKELVTTDAAYGSSIGHEIMRDTRHDAMSMPHTNKPHGFVEGLTSPLQQCVSPRQHDGRDHGTSAPEGCLDLGSTQPHMVQRTSAANLTGSPTLRRFSDKKDSSHWANPPVQRSGQYFNNGANRSQRRDEEDCPLSDRKIWVGGLPPDTDIQVLGRLLEPFGPFQLDNIKESKQPPHYRGNFGNCGGFTFAEFHDPQHAAGAVEALNGREIDPLHCRLCVKPARLHPPFNDHMRSPQKGITGYIGRDVSNHIRNYDRRYADDRAPRPSRNQTTQSNSKQYQQSTQWTELCIDHEQPNTALGLPVTSKASSAQSIYQPILYLDVTNSEHHGINDNHSSRPKDGNVRDRNASNASKSAVDSTASTTIQSPSPSKRKKGRMNKDGPSSDKEPQARKRKEMLSQLRTEKPSTGASDEVLYAMNPYECQHNNAPQTAFPKSTQDVPPNDQANNPKFLCISAPDLKEELEQYAPLQSDVPFEPLSRAQTASTSGRRLSSGSLVVSTDPTSYTQSEQSRSGTDGLQTPDTPKHQADFRTTPPPPKDLALRDSHLAYQVADSNITPTGDNTPTLIDEAASNAPLYPEASTATTEVQLSNKAVSAPYPSSTTATIKTAQKLSSPDVPREIGTGTDLVPGEHQQAPRVSPQHAEPTALSKATIETPETAPEKEHVDTFSSTDLSPTRRVGGPMQEMSPNTKIGLALGPSLKRGCSRDLGTLVAVPKVPPLMRPRARTRSTDTQSSRSPSKTTVSVEPLNLATTIHTKPHPATKEQEINMSPTEASLSSSVNEEKPTPSGVKEAEQTPTLLSTSNQESSTIMLSGQREDEKHDRSCDVASAPDSVTTSENNALNPDQSNPRPYLTAEADKGIHLPVTQASEQQPIIQQKKRKGKKVKKLKKPKPSTPSSGNGSSPAHSRSATKEEIKVPVVIPKVETPYLADDNTPLPQPSFVRHNHSSMIARKDLRHMGQQASSKDGNKSSMIKASASSVTDHSTSAEGSQPLLIFFLPGESTNPQASQDRQEKVAQVDDQPRAGDDQRTLSPEERQARLKVLDHHVQQNNLLPISHLLNVLAEVAPQESEQTELELYNASKSHSEESPDTLVGLGEPRVLEITSDDEAQPSFIPSVTPEEQVQHSAQDFASSLSSRLGDTSTRIPGHAQDFQGAEQLINAPSANRHEEHIVASSPSTRTASPERGQDHFASSVKDSGLSIAKPAATKSENVSPSRKQQPKTLSWKEIATKSPTSSLQPGDIVEFIPKDTDSGSKCSQVSGVVRKSGSKDPWRVPSAEQPWGKNNKSKGKPTGEAPNTKI
ncbi:MAG: hypothetical protein Q9213_000466 [Squamulea squamosa]